MRLEISKRKKLSYWSIIYSRGVNVRYQLSIDMPMMFKMWTRVFLGMIFLVITIGLKYFLSFSI